MKIAIGNDHTAIELKNIIKEFVEEKGYEVIDLGTNSTESCALYRKAVQSAQQLQRTCIWRQGSGQRACQDDYRGMAGR